MLNVTAAALHRHEAEADDKRYVLKTMISPARCICQIKPTVSHPKVRVSDVHVLSP